MNEIDELIKQARVVKARKRARINTERLSSLSWQELLDGKPYPNLRIGRL